MNLDKETLNLIAYSANEKANSAIKMKAEQPENAEFWQGQYQAFLEIHTMVEQMK